MFYAFFTQITTSVQGRLACICIYHNVLTFGAGTVIRHFNGTEIKKKNMYRKHAI